MHWLLTHHDKPGFAAFSFNFVLSPLFRVKLWHNTETIQLTLFRLMKGHSWNEEICVHLFEMKFTELFCFTARKRE